MSSQKELQGFAVRVRGVLREVVERVPKPCLPEHLERRASHPTIDVDLIS